MRIFVNDIPVRIVNLDKHLEEHYHADIDASTEPITQNRLVHHVLIRNISLAQLDALLQQLHKFELQNLYSLTLTTGELEDVRLFLKSKYKVIKAAGGVVTKGDKKLMIYRLKRWDLPKGKLNKGESVKDAAVREVEEECNIKVKLLHKICSTRHTYTMKNKDILKKTTWFLMECIDDSKKRPQKSEDIEELKWMSPKELHHALQHSYKSIRHVIRKNYELEEQLKEQETTTDKAKSQ